LSLQTLFPVFCPQASLHTLEPVQGLVLTRSPEQPVAVLLVLHEGGPMDQGLRCVPDDVGDGLLRVDPEEVLEDGEEGNFLRCILDPVEHGVEHVQVTRQVNIMGACQLRFVAVPLLLEDVQLHLEVAVLCALLQVPNDLQQFQAYELVPDPVTLLQLRRRYHQTVDEREQNSSVLV